MAWGVRWYLGGCVALGLFGVLAGCSGGGFFAEREPWRRDAEVQCINTGAVKESAGIVRIKSISGPGMCGADFPLRVSVLGRARRSALPTIRARQAPSPAADHAGRCGRPRAPTRRSR